MFLLVDAWAGNLDCETDNLVDAVSHTSASMHKMTDHFCAGRSG